MAIQVASTTVINNSLELQNISNTDATTSTAINNAIKSQNNVLRIYNSAGIEVRTFYCAQT